MGRITPATPHQVCTLLGGRRRAHVPKHKHPQSEPLVFLSLRNSTNTNYLIWPVLADCRQGELRPIRYRGMVLTSSGPGLSAACRRPIRYRGMVLTSSGPGLSAACRRPIRYRGMVLTSSGPGLSAASHPLAKL